MEGKCSNHCTHHRLQGTTVYNFMTTNMLLQWPINIIVFVCRLMIVLNSPRIIKDAFVRTEDFADRPNELMSAISDVGDGTLIHFNVILVHS